MFKISKVLIIKIKIAWLDKSLIRRPVTLLKTNSSTCVFLWNLWKIYEHLFCRTSASSCWCLCWGILALIGKSRMKRSLFHMIMLKGIFLKIKIHLIVKFYNSFNLPDYLVNLWTEFRHYTQSAIYMYKVNNRNTRATCEICSKLSIKTQKPMASN